MIHACTFTGPLNRLMSLWNTRSRAMTRSAPRKEIIRLILGLVVVYAAICVAAYFGNRLLMYFPDPTRPAFPRRRLAWMASRRSQSRLLTTPP